MPHGFAQRDGEGNVIGSGLIVAGEAMCAGLTVMDSGRMGTAALVAGVATVATADVTAASQVFLTRKTTGGTLGHLYVGTITPGVNFQILSSSTLDTSTVSWLIVESS